MKSFGMSGVKATRLLLCISIIFLASCRLVIETDETGYIVSDSGAFSCDRAQCIWYIDEEISDGLTAMPADGYRFVRWHGLCGRFPTDRCEITLAPTPDEYMEYDGDVPLWAQFEPTTEERAWYRDKDEDHYGDATLSLLAAEQPDGYVINKKDCDDNNPDAFPGNPEKRDGIDNNCNGKVDEGIDTTTWYRDHDRDGFGNPKVTQISDRQPRDFVANNLDCNDNDHTVHPEAREDLRDGIDNDCDGIIDSKGDFFYPDIDGDGFGRRDGGIPAAEQPEGYAPNRFDCDDENPSIHPEAEEILDSIDNDCDGKVDEGFINDEFFKDQDDDGYGDPEDWVEALEQPEGYVTNSKDNCPDVYNPRQKDVDEDGIGDACDDFTDSDDDEVQDSEDNCPYKWNPDQEDEDEDGRGDKCDEDNNHDWDDDEVPNEEDNCPEKWNPDQSDVDEDGKGDKCDEVDGREVEKEEEVVDCSFTDEDELMLAEVNEYRSEGRSCGSEGEFAAAEPLKWSCKLKMASLRHSKDMAKNDFFDHKGSDNSSAESRARDAGYEWSVIAENIAGGSTNRSVSSVVEGWIGSDGHCANIMLSSLVHMGAAKYSYEGSEHGAYWTQVLGKPD